jgi:hypothetical protein
LKTVRYDLDLSVPDDPFRGDSPVQQSKQPRNLTSILLTENTSVESTMQASTLFLCAVFLLISTVPWFTTAAQAPVDSSPAAQSDEEKRAMLGRVIANQKKNDEAEMVYERIERKEIRKGPAGTPPEIKTSRVVPAGTGVDHIPVGPDGKPTDANLYRAELEKLEHSLAWAAEEGRTQHDAYEKIAKPPVRRSYMFLSLGSRAATACSPNTAWSRIPRINPLRVPPRSLQKCEDMDGLTKRQGSLRVWKWR